MNYEDWVNSITGVSLPSYEELPQIPLYSDQVLEYTNAVLLPLFDGAVLTSAMINNYVKLKLMPAPSKKRYGRDHLAHIITITVLKQVISIPNIVAGILIVRETYGKEYAYNHFVECVHEGIQKATQQIPYENTPTKPEECVDVLVPMRAACTAFASKLIAEKSLEVLLNKRSQK